MLDNLDYPVLSVRQPWAWFIANGHKDVENRTWKVAYRGPLLIHASLNLDRLWLDALRAQGLEDFRRRIPVNDVAWLARGGIVGIATLADIQERSDSPWWDGRGYAWILKDAKPLRLIPCKGRQGLFRERGMAR